MYSYCEEIVRITEISDHATKQLITDIGSNSALASLTSSSAAVRCIQSFTEYFINVLDDLDLTPIDQLATIRDLLKADEAAFSDTSQSAQKSVAVAIRSMRNLSN